jgi:hypothetical protein
VQAGTFIIGHEIGLGLAWLQKELTALGPRAFIIYTSITSAWKDPNCAEATVAATERRNCRNEMSGKKKERDDQFNRQTHLLNCTMLAIRTCDSTSTADAGNGVL